MTKKWGESFLKSGLPLEHLAAVTLRSLDWACTPNFEYDRLEADGSSRIFEVDLVAETTQANRGTDLHLLIECKYHDESRFWFFHPLEPHRFYSDERVLNPIPFQTLAEPTRDLLLAFAPKSYWGVVVSEDGQKQDNAIYTAIEQLTHAFLPYVQHRISTLPYGPHGQGLLSFCLTPVIVTTARIFRLRPDVTDLAVIRDAAHPSEIADEVPWTWCYNEPSVELGLFNARIIDAILAEQSHATNIVAADQLKSFINRPNWIAVANVKYLEACVGSIAHSFWEADILDGIVGEY